MLFFIIAIGLTIFVFQACEQNSPVASNDTEVLQSTEINGYVIEYPAKSSEYKKQFYGGVHRSQLSDEQIQEYEDEIARQIAEEKVEGVLAKASAIESADYFFYVTSYKSYDEEDFNIAYQIWGAMLDYETAYAQKNLTGVNNTNTKVVNKPRPVTPGNWNTNTNYMTNNTDVTECRNFLATYAPGSGITSLISSTSAYPLAGQELLGGTGVPIGGGSEALGKISGNNGIETVPTDYVAANLNPSYETWGSFPTEWNTTIPSPYNIPAVWNNYYSSSDVTANTFSQQGTYSARLYLNRNVGSCLTSKYFLIPADLRDAGYWGASLYLGGNPQSVILNLQVTFYDDNDAIIQTESVALTAGAGGAFQYNSNHEMLVTTPPKYVRFSIVQEVGQNRNYVYIDNLALNSPQGDVSLPVILADDIVAHYYYNNGHQIACEWETQSEIDNFRFMLFYRDVSNNITLASNDWVPGLGNSAVGQYYEESFVMLTAAYNYMVQQGDLYVFLGAQSYNGLWEYYEDQGDWLDW